MSNPLEQHVCIGCGAPLVGLDIPLWGMCSKCIAGTKVKLATMKKNKKSNERNPKRFKMYIPMLARNK